jgi:SPP1 family predicted phage head-tail adaptor
MGCDAKIARPKRRVCIGDLDSLVQLRSRAIQEPVFGSAEPSEDFGEPGTAWAMIKTTRGKTAFNTASQEVALTHEVFIRFDARVSSETWVELDDGRLLDIVRVQDLDERHEFQLLECAERGPRTTLAAQA